MDADPFEVEESLDELVELGLVEFIGQRRYRLHDLLRLFSARELRHEEEKSGDAAQARLRSWLLSNAAMAGSLFAPSAVEGQAGRPEWLADRAAADQWLRWNREQWWPAFQHAARSGHDCQVVSVAEALHWYAPTWMAWNSWQALYSLSVEAAQRIGDTELESIQLGYLAWAHLVEQADARSALKRASEALLAAQEANDDLTLGWANLYKGWALHSLGDHEAATMTLDESALAFDRVAYSAGAAQARSIAREAIRDAAEEVD
jgi:hypothetical protein